MGLERLNSDLFGYSYLACVETVYIKISRNIMKGNLTTEESLLVGAIRVKGCDSLIFAIIFNFLMDGKIRPINPLAQTVNTSLDHVSNRAFMNHLIDSWQRRSVTPGKSISILNPLNIAAGIKDDTDYILSILEHGAEYKLSQEQKAIAKLSISEFPEEVEPTILDLCELWASSPALADFAQALKLNFLR